MLAKIAKNKVTRQFTLYRGTKAIGAYTLGNYDNTGTAMMVKACQKDGR